MPFITLKLIIHPQANLAASTFFPFANYVLKPPPPSPSSFSSYLLSPFPFPFPFVQLCLATIVIEVEGNHQDNLSPLYKTLFQVSCYWSQFFSITFFGCSINQSRGLGLVQNHCFVCTMDIPRIYSKILVLEYYK